MLGAVGSIILFAGIGVWIDLEEMNNPISDCRTEDFNQDRLLEEIEETCK